MAIYVTYEPITGELVADGNVAEYADIALETFHERGSFHSTVSNLSVINEFRMRIAQGNYDGSTGMTSENTFIYVRNLDRTALIRFEEAYEENMTTDLSHDVNRAREILRNLVRIRRQGQ